MMKSQLPLLIKPASSQDDHNEESSIYTCNPFSIMQEIAKSVYLEEVLLGKFDSSQRHEVRKDLLWFILKDSQLGWGHTQKDTRRTSYTP